MIQVWGDVYAGFPDLIVIYCIHVFKGHIALQKCRWLLCIAITILITHIRLNERLCDGDFADLKSLNKKLGDQKKDIWEGLKGEKEKGGMK